MAEKKREVWGVITPSVPPGMLAAQARMLEQAGVDGLFAPQVYGPPFVPLAAAAAVTSRVKLASGIALAFARSPFETAMAALDMDRMSGGRFVLGLGCSVRSWSEGFFGMPYGKPLEHMREVVEIVRQVMARAHTGELKRYDGKYHHHDWSELQPSAPPLRPDLPIWIAGLRGPLVSLAAEIADGVMGHPIWSVQWATTKMVDALKRGLDRGGKQRSDVHVNLWPWVAISNDRKQAIVDAKPTIAFYAGVEQYEEYWAAHGFRKEAKALQDGVKRGDYVGVAGLVPDAMVEAFVACGTADEVRKKVAPMWEVADSLCPVPPAYALPPDRLMAYGAAIASTFYG
ncbi:MAG TPA: LLM class flavin-dependent oxidoreductase [Dehalococcoidia bacterium]|nr:LLM class flavin-dependent oxidoreductase [Dehalococcoidia bacterium]